MKIKSGMTEEGRKKMVDELRHYLADLYSVYLKTQNFHWNVKSPHFFALHLLFEKQYQEMAEEADEVAERIQSLGFHVDATFSTFQKCCIKEDKKPIPAKKMIEILVSDHEAVIRCGRKLGEIAEETNDQATTDLIGRRLGAHEKMAWMLRSHL
jgi:starvation-inducible DNA-binding protein